jgi:DNA polymerase III epsilon subunit-like protein
VVPMKMIITYKHIIRDPSTDHDIKSVIKTAEDWLNNKSRVLIHNEDFNIDIINDEFWKLVKEVIVFDNQNNILGRKIIDE